MNGVERVVGIDPTTKGFAYVVFEDPETLIDWGHAEVRPLSHESCLERITRLLARYEPAALVCEDITHPSCQRRQRVKNLLTALQAFTYQCGVETLGISQHDVENYFSAYDAHTKYARACCITAWFPELSPYLPPKRKLWMSEDLRINTFDAAALVLTAFGHVD